MNKKSSLLLASTALIGATFSSAASAQQATTVPPAAADSDQKSDEKSDNNSNIAQRSAEQRRDAITGNRNDSNTGEIIVTGTRITRPNLAAAAPITSVTSQDIQAQAPVSIEEVLNRLPQVAPDEQQNYQDSSGRQRVKLRSLDYERTLVLVDGQRLSTLTGEDVGILPPSLIDRVDVLTGGASSVYGSDAVAGVVNFILKKNFSGLKIDAQYGFYNHDNKDTIASPIARADGFPSPTGMSNDGGRSNLTVTYGKNLLNDTLNISVFGSYRAEERVAIGDRSSSPCYLLQAVKDGPLSCQVSTYSPSGYVVPESGDYAGQSFVNDPAGTRTFVPFGPGPGNGANPYDDYSLQRQFKRYTAGGLLNWKLSPAAQIYFTAIWNRDESTNPTPDRSYSYLVFSGTPYQVNCDNPFLSDSQRSVLCGTQTTGLVPLDVRYRFDAFPPNEVRNTNTVVRLSGGIRGDVAQGFAYDVGGVYSRTHSPTIQAAYSDPVRENRSLDVVDVNGTPTCVSVIDGSDPACVPFDAFKANNSNAALQNYLFGTNNYEKAVQTAYLTDVVASVTGDFTRYGIKSPWAEQGLAVALGGEYRKDRIKMTGNDAYHADYGGTDTDNSQHVWEGNIEVQAPLIQKKPWMYLLQANGGYRISKYNDNSRAFTTWKAEALFAPIRDITFRASFNKAQRAPNPLQVMQATAISFQDEGSHQNDFCAPAPHLIADPNHPGQTITSTAPIASRQVCEATGLPDSLYGSPTLLCPDDACTVRFGGFTIDPETAHTQTYGVVLQPRFLKGFSLSVDYFSILIDNSINYNFDNYFSDGCLQSNGDPFFCSKIVRAPNGIIYSPASSNPTSGFLRSGLANYYKSFSRGIDIQSTYSVPAGRFGHLDFSFNGSLATKIGQQVSPTRPVESCAGYINPSTCNQLVPRWSHTLSGTFTSADKVFNLTADWRYLGSLTNATNSGDPAIGGTPDAAQMTFYHLKPVSYFDLSMGVNVAKRLELRLAINNLLDRSPQLIPNSSTLTNLYVTNYIGSRYDGLGRNIVVSASTRF